MTAAQEYLQKITSTTSLNDALDIAASQLLDSCFGSSIPGLPIPIWTVLDFWHVRVRNSPLVDRKANAYLLARRGGFDIAMRPTLREDMKRFVVAHELSHTLFYDRPSEQTVPVREVPPSEQEEKICDSLARRILMPSNKLRGLDVGGSPPDPREVLLICRTARVQLFHGLQRLWEVGLLGNSVVVLWEPKESRPMPRKILLNEAELGYEARALFSNWEKANFSVYNCWERGTSTRSIDLVNLGPLHGFRDVTTLCVDEGVRKVAQIIPVTSCCQPKN